MILGTNRCLVAFIATILMKEPIQKEDSNSNNSNQHQHQY